MGNQSFHPPEEELRKKISYELFCCHSGLFELIDCRVMAVLVSHMMGIGCESLTIVQSSVACRYWKSTWIEDQSARDSSNSEASITLHICCQGYVSGFVRHLDENKLTSESQFL